MRTDAYTKAVLTIIAVALVLIAAGGPSVVPAVEAQDRTCAPVSAQTTNVVALMGNTRSEITAVFPGMETRIRQWNEWKMVYLLFNGMGKLVAVHLQPACPVTEQQADDAVQRLGVSVEPGNYFAAAAEHGYGNMGGPIRTVIYGVEGGKVTGIGIFSRLA